MKSLSEIIAVVNGGNSLPALMYTEVILGMTNVINATTMPTATNSM